MSNRQFFGLTHMYGQAVSDKPGIDNRPAIIRRVECMHCEHHRTNWIPRDDKGNIQPKFFCQLLDVENAKIEADNQLRHPLARLKYWDCPHGPLEDLLPKYPAHASDYVPY